MNKRCKKCNFTYHKSFKGSKKGFCPDCSQSCNKIIMNDTYTKQRQAYINKGKLRVLDIVIVVGLLVIMISK